MFKNPYFSLLFHLSIQNIIQKQNPNESIRPQKNEIIGLLIIFYIFILNEIKAKIFRFSYDYIPKFVSRVEFYIRHYSTLKGLRDLKC